MDNDLCPDTATVPVKTLNRSREQIQDLFPVDGRPEWSKSHMKDAYLMSVENYDSVP